MSSSHDIDDFGYINSPTMVAMPVDASMKSENDYGNIDSDCVYIDVDPPVKKKVEALAPLKSTGLDDDDSVVEVADETKPAVSSLMATDEDDSGCVYIDVDPPVKKKVEALASLKSTGEDDDDSVFEIVETKKPPPAAASLKFSGDDDEVEIIGTKPPPKSVASLKSTGDDDVVEIIPLRDGNNEFDVESAFSYGGFAARKASSSHRPPPQSLSLVNAVLQYHEDVAALMEQLESLHVVAPDVKKEDLVKPDEQDKKLEKSIKGLHAQGKRYYDPAPYLEQGMSEDHAKRVAILVSSVRNNQFEIMCSKDNSSGLLTFKGIKCRHCDLPITDVFTCSPYNLPKKVKDHNGAACAGYCTDCGFSRQELYAEYKESLYMGYEKTLLPGEPKVSRDTFFQVAASRPDIANGIPFLFGEQRVFKMHIKKKRSGNTDCYAWLEAKELFKNYIFKSGTDTITQANCDKLGLTSGEKSKMCNFRNKHYKKNGDGTYGSTANSLLVKFTGHRHDIIRALHSSLEE